MREIRRAPTLPPEEGEAGMGRAVPLLAALGLIVLLATTLPAIAEHRRLLGQHAQLVRETEAVEARLAAWRSQVRDAETLGYLRMRTVKHMAYDGLQYRARRERELAAGQGAVETPKRAVGTAVAVQAAAGR